MLWDSIIYGFSVLSSWQFWVASLSFSAIFILLFIALGLGLSKSMESGRTAPLGCLAGMILPIFLQVVFISMLVVFLMPILMGGDELTPISYLSNEWWRIVKAGFFGFITLMIIAFVPIVGGLVTNTSGVSVFVIGMVIFHRLVGSKLREIQELNNVEIDLNPDFWTIIGFIILAAIIVWGLTFLIVAGLMSIGIVDEERMESGALFLGPAIGAIPGLIALAIYISYVMLTLMQEINLNY